MNTKQSKESAIEHLGTTLRARRGTASAMDGIQQGWRPVPPPERSSEQPQYIIIAERMIAETPTPTVRRVDPVLLKRRRESDTSEVIEGMVMMSAEVPENVNRRVNDWCRANNYTKKSLIAQAVLEALERRGG